MVLTLTLVTMNVLNSKAQNIDVSKLKPASRTDTSFVVGSGDTQSHLPMIIFKGKEKGPVFTIVAGIHGYEYPPIVAVQELINEIDVQTLKGTLIVLPMANVAAFYGRTPFLNPLDGKNLIMLFQVVPTEQLPSRLPI